MPPCNRCTMIVAARNLVTHSTVKLSDIEKERLITRFIQGGMSFKSLGTSLGYNDTEMAKYLSINDLNRDINGQIIT